MKRAVFDQCIYGLDNRDNGAILGFSRGISALDREIITRHAHLDNNSLPVKRAISVFPLTQGSVGIMLTLNDTDSTGRTFPFNHVLATSKKEYEAIGADPFELAERGVFKKAEKIQKTLDIITYEKNTLDEADSLNTIDSKALTSLINLALAGTRCYVFQDIDAEQTVRTLFQALPVTARANLSFSTCVRSFNEKGEDRLKTSSQLLNSKTDYKVNLCFVPQFSPDATIDEQVWGKSYLDLRNNKSNSFRLIISQVWGKSYLDLRNNKSKAVGIRRNPFASIITSVGFNTEEGKQILHLADQYDRIIPIQKIPDFWKFLKGVADTGHELSDKEKTILVDYWKSFDGNTNDFLQACKQFSRNKTVLTETITRIFLKECEKRLVSETRSAENIKQLARASASMLENMGNNADAKRGLIRICEAIAAKNSEFLENVLEVFVSEVGLTKSVFEILEEDAIMTRFEALLKSGKYKQKVSQWLNWFVTESTLKNAVHRIIKADPMIVVECWGDLNNSIEKQMYNPEAGESIYSITKSMVEYSINATPDPQDIGKTFNQYILASSRVERFPLELLNQNLFIWKNSARVNLEKAVSEVLKLFADIKYDNDRSRLLAEVMSSFGLRSVNFCISKSTFSINQKIRIYGSLYQHLLLLSRNKDAAMTRKSLEKEVHQESACHTLPEKTLRLLNSYGCTIHLSQPRKNNSYDFHEKADNISYFNQYHDSRRKPTPWLLYGGLILAFIITMITSAAFFIYWDQLKDKATNGNHIAGSLMRLKSSSILRSEPSNRSLNQGDFLKGYIVKVIQRDIGNDGYQWLKVSTNQKHAPKGWLREDQLESLGKVLSHNEAEMKTEPATETKLNSERAIPHQETIKKDGSRVYKYGEDLVKDKSNMR